MKYCYLLGHPVGHSMSGVMQNAAFHSLRLSCRYELWDVGTNGIVPAVMSLKRPIVLGANVTIPHKIGVVHLMDRLDSFAQLVGAVNLIVNEGGSLAGYNTDGPAATRALKEVCGPLRGSRILLLGAGGAARSVCHALASEGTRLVILNRDEAKAKQLAGEIGAESGSLREISSRVRNSDILINTTPVGMSPESGSSPVNPSLLLKDLTVFDLVYNPAETQLLRDAKATGARTLSGIKMLVYQGAAAFKLWTGKDAPIHVMESAVLEGLGGVHP